MIPRADRRWNNTDPRTIRPEVEAILPGATKEITVTDYDFSFGPGDAVSYALGPGDTFAITDEGFLLTFADGEEVTIPRYEVRLWSRSSRKVTVPALSV